MRLEFGQKLVRHYRCSPKMGRRVFSIVQFISLGFQQGIGSPCNFYSPIRFTKCSVHCDDFTSLGEKPQLLWLRQEFEEKYAIKFRGILGPDPDEVREISHLNRFITLDVENQEIRYEADPRHVDIIVKQAGVAAAKSVSLR